MRWNWRCEELIRLHLQKLVNLIKSLISVKFNTFHGTFGPETLYSTPWVFKATSWTYVAERSTTPLLFVLAWRDLWRLRRSSVLPALVVFRKYIHSLFVSSRTFRAALAISSSSPIAFSCDHETMTLYSISYKTNAERNSETEGSGCPTSAPSYAAAVRCSSKRSLVLEIEGV